jgi:hypothetical protein
MDIVIELFVDCISGLNDVMMCLVK